MKALIIIMALGLSASSRSQQVFSADELAAVVRKFHPLARQALMQVRIAEANVTAAKGVFDPVLNTYGNNKEFEGTRYYNERGGELKIPVWYGVDLYAGSEKFTGERLNAKETKGTVNYVGISVPLLQNVIIDKRRAIIKQAALLRDETEAARKAALNDLLSESLVDYWKWWADYRSLEVVRTALQNARQRYEMVHRLYSVGERPAIDTLEALMQVRLFEQQETEAQLNLQQSRLQISLYLWNEELVPYELPDNIQPDSMAVSTFLARDDFLPAARVHPRLLAFELKLKGLGIEKRMKFQKLFPEVRVDYNNISREFLNTFADAGRADNFRFGISVSLPLRMSEARGEYRAAKLRLEQAAMAQAAEQLAINVRVKQLYAEAQQATVQYGQQQGLVQNYLELQKGEEMKFRNGESSLFMMNSREAALLEAQKKLLLLAAGIQQAKVRLRGAAGEFGEL